MSGTPLPPRTRRWAHGAPSRGAAAGGAGGEAAADVAEEILQALLREDTDSFDLEGELAELLHAQGWVRLERPPLQHVAARLRHERARAG